MNNNNLGFGFIVAGAGLLVIRFLGNFELPAMEFLWPLFVIVPGIGMLYAAYVIGDNEIRLAIPGAIVTATGIILATFNTFGHWEAWAYAWTFYPIVVGATMNYIGWQKEKPTMQQTGRTTLTIGILLFAGFAFFFEGIIFSGNASWLDSTLWPILLIVAGFFMVLNRRDSRENTQNKVKNDHIHAG